MPTQQYNQEEMWKIFEKLPEELKEAVFSAENAEHTFSGWLRSRRILHQKRDHDYLHARG
ncbi:MAG: hypothetical protein UY53_C0004G0035 [Parcubacteria group bacterium GW2011_GWA2_50_10]|nr:MAG: hypothetical protein UY53_C0004G0035 [Parcubacteria group bacterium GW2011_GWA2_50_10]